MKQTAIFFFKGTVNGIAWSDDILYDKSVIILKFCSQSAKLATRSLPYLLATKLKEQTPDSKRNLAD